MKTLIGSLMVVGLAATFAPAASAAAPLLPPHRLSPADAAALKAEVAQARARTPQVFEQLAAIRASVPALDAHKRGLTAPVSPLLKRLNRDVTWAALEAIAISGPGVDGFAPSAARAYWLGLIEIVGMNRDERALPVLFALLDSPQLEANLVRPTAEAAGRIGTDAAVAGLLTRVAASAGAKQLAIWSGMGACRRLKTTEALAAALVNERDATRAKVFAKALADAGNAGAWRTDGAPFKTEEQPVKTTAAKALVEALTRFDGEAQQAAAEGLLIVDSPSTPSLLAEAKAKVPAGRQDRLEHMQAQFERNPARLR